MLILKFGGTSVGDAARITRAAGLAVEAAANGQEVVVVTSAMSGVTNDLIKAAQQAAQGHWQPEIRERLFARHKDAADTLFAEDPERHRAVVQTLAERLDRFEKLLGLSSVHELTPRLLDAISGIGETLCAPLLAGALATKGWRSEAVNATELIVTTDRFGAAEPMMVETRTKTRERLLPLTAEHVIPVVTGFIASTRDGVLTTLGRGGSDYSASLIGAALDADEVWIWTDVDGVMTANPHEVPDACTLSEISYGEASELAYYGAKILHYKTVLPLMRQGIPLRILNSLNPTHPGTLVSAVGCLSASGVKAVTSIGNVALIAIDGKGMQEIPGVAAKALEAVSAEQANVLLTSQASSEKNISIAINASDAPRVTRALRSAFEFEVTLGHIDEISAVNSLAVVAVVGEGMKRTAGIATTTFGALGTAGVKVIAISQGSSERSISLLVAEKDAATSVRAIHRAFQLEKSASSQDRRTLEQVSR